MGASTFVDVRVGAYQSSTKRVIASTDNGSCPPLRKIICGTTLRLRKQVVRLKGLREKDKVELEQLRADVEGLVRVVNQLTLENRQLRGRLSAPDPAVHVLPVQCIPPRPS